MKSKTLNLSASAFRSLTDNPAKHQSVAGIITEIKTTLSGERKEFECELLRASAGEAIVIYRMPGDVQLEDVYLPKNTISVGYFWEHKAFNAYHWIDDEQNTLALYFNICDSTHISNRQIEWRDLVVDVLITTDGRCRVLDEHELPGDLSEDLRLYIETTCDDLCLDPRSRLAKFDQCTRELIIAQKGGS